MYCLVCLLCCCLRVLWRPWPQLAERQPLFLLFSPGSHIPSALSCDTRCRRHLRVMTYLHSQIVSLRSPADLDLLCHLSPPFENQTKSELCPCLSLTERVTSWCQFYQPKS